MPTPPASPAAEQLPARTAAVWAALDPVVGAGTPLRVLDVGGGSGMFAVPLARLGHDVTVVDPSADALATLRRRADTAGVGDRVRGVQGDGDLLHEVLPAARRPAPATTSRCATRPRGRRRPRGDPRRDRRRAAPRRSGEHRDGQPRRAPSWAGPSAGHPVEALALLEDRDPTPGRDRPARRRFNPAGLLALVEGAGLRPGPVARGLRRRRPARGRAPARSPGAVRALELALAEASPFRDIATGLHVLAARP